MITPHHVGGLVLAPILATQGLWTRRVVPKLPEPPCPRSGKVGCGQPLRLLVLGDSAAQRPRIVYTPGYTEFHNVLVFPAKQKCW